MHLESAFDCLPVTLLTLRKSARREGYAFIERLYAEWDSGLNRFDKPGEKLLIASVNGRVAGIGGMTQDPVDPTALRMRRFYVDVNFRRRGVARNLALPLIQAGLKTDRPLYVNAGTHTAPVFWESLGFQKVKDQAHTHAWPRP